MSSYVTAHQLTLTAIHSLGVFSSWQSFRAPVLISRQRPGVEVHVIRNEHGIEQRACDRAEQIRGPSDLVAHRGARDVQTKASVALPLSPERQTDIVFGHHHVGNELRTVHAAANDFVADGSAGAPLKV